MPEEPTNGEIARQLGDFRQDFRDDIASVRGDISSVKDELRSYVLREVYLADKAAWELRMSRSERETETNRAAARTAIYAAVSSVFATVAAGVILAMIVKGG